MMRRRIIVAGVVVVAVAAAFGGYAAFRLLMSRDTGQTDRRTQWAVAVEKPGLPNLHRVTKDLYRGAQPTAEGMKELAAMGVKTVVNLRAFHSDRDEIGDTPLAYESISVKTWHPEAEDVVKFLRIVFDPNRAPVFVHCQRGADRTGLMCAIYRVAVCGWTKQEAEEEMTKGGFGFAEVWENMVDFLDHLDIDRMMQEAKAASDKRTENSD